MLLAPDGQGERGRKAPWVAGLRPDEEDEGDGEDVHCEQGEKGPAGGSLVLGRWTARPAV